MRGPALFLGLLAVPGPSFLSQLSNAPGIADICLKGGPKISETEGIICVLQTAGIKPDVTFRTVADQDNIWALSKFGPLLHGPLGTRPLVRTT